MSELVTPNIAPASVRTNAAYNAAGFIATLAVAFLLSPFLVKNLGDSRYGVWVLMNDLTGYYGFLDIGIRGAVGYYVARHQADQNHAELENVVNTAFWALAVAGVLVLAIGVPLSLSFATVFRVGDTPPAEIVPAAVIMTTVVAANLPLSLSAAMLNGFRRVDLIVKTEIGVKLLVSSSVYLLVRSGHGLVAISLASAAGTAMLWVLRAFQLRRLGSALSVWPIRFRWSAFREVSRVGSANVANNASLLLVNHIQPLIVAGVLGTAALSSYSLGRQVPGYYHAMMASIAMSMTTAFTYHHTRGDRDTLIRMFLSGTRLNGSLALFLGVSIVVFGRDFLYLWIGPRYVEGDLRMRSDIVLLVVAVGTILRTFQTISVQLLIGTRKLRFITGLRLAEACATIVGTVALVKPFGLLGVALGWSLPMIISHTILFPYTLRAFEMPVRQYWHQAVAPAMLVGGVTAATAVLTKWMFPPTSWPRFLIDCAAVTGVVGVAFVFGAMTIHERRSLLFKVGIHAEKPAK